MTEVRVDDLNAGDQIWSPAGRWEIVTSVSPSSDPWLMRVVTDRTGSGYAWPLDCYRKVETVRARHLRETPSVRVWDHQREIVAWVGTGEYLYRTALTLAQAFPRGRGLGWEVRDRPDGGELRVTGAPSKAAAAVLVRKAARAHAKALGLPLQVGGDR